MANWSIRSRLFLFVGLAMFPVAGLLAAMVFATVQDTARNVILVSLLVLGLVFWSLTVATRRLVAEPYAALADTAQRLARGDLTARTTLPHNRSEAGTLAAAIDGMAVALAKQREERDAAARVRLQLAEEKAAHAAAERESRRVQALLDANPDPLVVVDAGGLVVAANRRTQVCFGYDQDELLGRPVEILVPDLQRAGHRVLSAEYLKAPQPQLMTARQVQGLRRDGTAFPVEITLSPVELAEGMMVIASVRDVTDRREAEEQLRQSEERFRLLFNLTLDGVLEIDPEDGRIFAANPAACSMLGGTPEQLKGLTRSDYTDTTDARLSEAIQVRARIGQYRSEFTLRRLDGTTFEAEVSSVAYQTGPGEPRASLIVRDITQRRALEAANQAARVAAEAANRAKSEFLSRMSHELRTPLNAVLGFAQLLGLDPLSEEQRDSVDHISRAGRHLLQLINEVLDIARIEAGNLELSLEPVSVSLALQEAIGLTRPLAERAGVTLLLRGADASLYLRADRHRLHQVLLNLLSNAVKYNRSGGSVTVSPSLHGDVVRIQVDDTGSGIPGHRLAELFEPFNRLGAERTEIEGSGIGLAVTRRLMEAMGGKIGVESTIGTGTSFWVDLPTTDPPEMRHAADGLTSAPAPPVELPAVTLLYVEDNLSNLSLVTRLVERWPQVRLLSALQGRLGFELAREQHPDLILLDLHLPDLPGDEVLARLQADPQTTGIPVVMLSADASPNRVKHLIGMGARAYLTKPLDLRELIKLIDEVAGDRCA